MHLRLQMGSLKEIALAAAFICMLTPSGGTAEPACKVFQSYEHGFTANIRLVRSRNPPISATMVRLKGCAHRTRCKLSDGPHDIKKSYDNIVIVAGNAGVSLQHA